MDYYVLDKKNQLEPVAIYSSKELEDLLGVTREKLHRIVFQQKEINNRYVLVETHFKEDSEKYFQEKKLEENQYTIWYLRKDGKVFSINKNTKNKKYHHCTKDSKGNVKVRVNNKICLLKNLLAKAFLNDWYEGCVVGIKNGDNSDLRIENLKIYSKKELLDCCAVS